MHFWNEKQALRIRSTHLVLVCRAGAPMVIKEVRTHESLEGVRMHPSNLPWLQAWYVYVEMHISYLWCILCICQPAHTYVV